MWLVGGGTVVGRWGTVRSPKESVPVPVAGPWGRPSGSARKVGWQSFHVTLAKFWARAATQPASRPEPTKVTQVSPALSRQASGSRIG
jgi:hypothetical protein